MQSLSTDEAKLTAHLMSPDFFDVRKFPTASFVSTQIRKEQRSGTTHVLVGNLTLHGVTCLVAPRRLLVLDEALTGVDSTGEMEFAALLNNLKQEHNWTILEVSHDLDLVSKYCDSVICLNRRLLYQGSPSTTLTPENLLHIYGSLVSPICHHHEPSRLPESF